MGHKVNRHKVKQPCLTNLWHCTYSEIHRVSQKTKYEINAKKLDGVFYEKPKRIKQKHGQSLQLLAILLGQAGRTHAAETRGK
jgi:hypothetical protein